ncbi:MAG: HIT family protein [Acidimicrobiales bacterium]
MSQVEGLGRLWAGWRTAYIEGTTNADRPEDGESCVFCRILASGAPDAETLVVARRPLAVAILNLYPYTSGHLMVLPTRHVAELEELGSEEGAELWGVLADSVRALKAAYRPEGLNVGANLGRAGGAGIPDHVHLHCVPRWSGDTNFMTSVAEARVLPEALSSTHARIRAAWPAGGGSHG